MIVKRISAEKARDMLKTRPNIQIVDIRDAHSFGASHIPGSTHLSEQNIEEFIEETRSDTALIVMCYHGISSQSATAYLSSRGFIETYSMDGGFEAWKLLCEELRH
ncbi:MAG: thiosulfate sulfurtransferase GlpE [Gammaproteobacteria bacterium]|nr:thiosulfate sulfurtransferase GlpE [Gammaproteobacteria bacterium]|tara:strand:- start:15946 stop:16263 length:318 start_codon:yes stop_codon:yes gene_type:complete